MTDRPETAFRTTAERALIAHGPYGVFDWHTDHRLTYPTVELTLGVDGYQQLALDAAVGRQLAAWRARNPGLAAALDAEAALDTLAGQRW
jgi:hypothetical protein